MFAGLAEEHVKAAIVSGLRRRGMDLVTAVERGSNEVDDEVLLERATAEGRVLLTNDTDLLRIHGRWLQEGRSHAGIVFWQQGLPVGVAIHRILEYARNTSPADATDRLQFQ